MPRTMYRPDSRVVGQKPLEILLDKGHKDGQDDRHAPTVMRTMPWRALLQLEEVQVMRAKEVDPRSFSKRAGRKAMKVTERHGRVRIPGMERHGAGLATAPTIMRMNARPPGPWLHDTADMVSVPVVAQRRPMPRMS